MKQINITGVIGWDATPQKLREDLADAGGAPVEILVSSPGGFVGDGLEMFNLIRNYKGDTVARLSGYAMSMASYIPLAAKRIVAEDNAVYMIHNARGAVWGDHNDIIAYGETTRGLSRLLARAYAKRTGKSLDDVQAMMDRETYFFGADMVEHGFVDELIESGEENDRETVVACAAALYRDCQARLSADVTASRNDMTRVAAIVGSLAPLPHRADEPTTTGGQPMTLAELRAQHPDLVSALVAEAIVGMITAEELQVQLATASAEAATAERARIQAVEAQCMPGHEALIASLKFDGKTSGDQAAAAVVAAERGVRSAHLAAMESDAPPVIPAVEGSDGGSDANAPLEERAKAQWDKSAELRAEFGGKFAAFLAYQRNAESGRARVLGKK